LRLAALSRYWRTLKYLKPVQFYGRLWFKLVRPKPSHRPAPAQRPVEGTWQVAAQRDASMTGPGAFLFLGQEGSLQDHGWDGPLQEKLWRYNQHYFDDLNAVGAAERRDWHLSLIADWIAANPAGQGSGWEPYPTSLRMVNWIKWALGGSELSADALASLAVQARWLMRRLEWHLQGNHLFINAKALVFAGLFFTGREADTWLAKGQSILAQQMPEQILPDGGQFELSPTYHALALEDMLDLVNVAQASGRTDLAASWRLPIPAMLTWLGAMSHPDGRIAFFNDAAFGVAPDNAQLFGYAARLGFDHPGVPDGLHHLKHSGYVRIAGFGATMIADVGKVGPDYIPGHAHADTLSFEMSIGERRLIVNSGTSVYGLSAERQRQRGTSAHSTLVIDHENSSEVWSGFRVGRRARPFDVTIYREDDRLIAGAAHDGYTHLVGKPVHRRDWVMAPEALTVTDTVTGKGQHSLEALLFLAPGLSATEQSAGSLEIVDSTGQRVAHLRGEGGALDMVSATWHPSFGASEANRCIRLTADATLPHKMIIQIEWDVS